MSSRSRASVRSKHPGSTSRRSKCSMSQASGILPCPDERGSGMELELALLIGPEAPGSAPEYVISVCASDRRSVTLSSLATGAVATWIPKTPSEGDLASTITGLVAIHLMGAQCEDALRSDDLTGAGSVPSHRAGRVRRNDPRGGSRRRAVRSRLLGSTALRHLGSLCRRGPMNPLSWTFPASVLMPRHRHALSEFSLLRSHSC